MSAKLAIESHEDTILLTSDKVDRMPIKSLLVIATHEPDPTKGIAPITYDIRNLNPDLVAGLAIIMVRHPGLWEAVNGMMVPYRTGLIQ